MAVEKQSSRGTTIMILNDWLSKEFIESIPYIATYESEKANVIYNMVRMFYGKKSTSAAVDYVVENGLDKSLLAETISDLYSNKWKTIKDALNADIPITDHTKTETTNNSIYGYNGDKAPDYTTEKTTDENYTNVFDMIQENVEMRDKLSYYSTVIKDIAHTLTTMIYE